MYSLVPRLPCSGAQICGENLESFLTKALRNQKRARIFWRERQHFVHLFMQIHIQRLVCRIFTRRYTCEVNHPLPLLFLSLRYVRMQLRSFYPLSTHMRKYTRLSTCTSSKFAFWSGEAWEWIYKMCQLKILDWNFYMQFSLFWQCF